MKSSRSSAVDPARATRHLMDLLRVEGSSGQERAAADLVRRKLIAAGCKPAWIRFDDAPKRIPLPFETGNLIVTLPGTTAGARRMFLGHLDTVPLCRGAVPVRKGNRIVARGATAVRADNRTAVACLVTLAETLLWNGLPHPPLTLLFTVGEEIGLYGAKALNLEDAGQPAVAFNFDSGDPNQVITGAIGATRWEAEVRGVSSHAGMSPEQGVSAMLAAARALRDAAAGGWFGKIVKGRRAGTANAGVIRGGEATNQVTDYVYVKGECRSHDPAFLKTVTAAWRTAFERAARSVKNAAGQRASVDFRVSSDYAAFRLPDAHPAVRFACGALQACGLTPKIVAMNGGLDANPLNEKGLPTLTFGCGQHGAHSVKEYVDVKEYLAGCRLAAALATQPM